MGALKSDSVYKSLVNSIHNTLLGTSTTPGANLSRLSDIGISIDKSGSLNVSATKLDSALKDNLADVTKIFSANTDDDNEIGIKGRGVAGDISKIIADATARTAILLPSPEALSSRVTEHGKEPREARDQTVSRLQERYTQQFLTMQQVIDSMNNTKII